MKKTELCAYRYDPLDRLIGIKSNQQSDNLRFYCKSRLATEIQGNTHHAIMQHGDQLLAQHTYNATDQTNALFATDLQRSVLRTVTDDVQLNNAYAPYGHTTAIPANQVLGFNGERPEFITGYYLLGNGYRAFNPILMRFNSPDSLSPFDKGGINCYNYCLDDPINNQDPSGHFIAHLSKLFAIEGIASSVTSMILALSSPARTSGSAFISYVAGSVGVLYGGVALTMTGTRFGAIMAGTSSALGAISTAAAVRTSLLGRRAVSSAIPLPPAHSSLLSGSRSTSSLPSYPGSTSSLPKYESLTIDPPPEYSFIDPLEIRETTV